ncbi:hypothetical protein HDV02_000158 [Globomyces sp. JEL0801]|nr:hypothetical protein HDV02_000158 [Globomyces sp. JEL0801]
MKVQANLNIQPGELLTLEEDSLIIKVFLNTEFIGKFSVTNSMCLARFLKSDMIRLECISNSYVEDTLVVNCHFYSAIRNQKVAMSELKASKITFEETDTDRMKRLKNITIDLGFLSNLSTVDLAKLPLFPNRPRDINATLLKHQYQALAWLIKMENPKFDKSTEPVQFWKKQKVGSLDYYNHIVTGLSTSEHPILCRGGILADDMGLGKSTLIICPLSVIMNWELQISEHIAPGSLSYYIYHGPNRNKSSKFLAKHKLVITTYQTVAGEYSDGDPKEKLKPTLVRVKWKRIVLDEGHHIRNYNSIAFKACNELNAERRWFVTGTPFTNKIEDFFSILKFLRYRPFHERKEWTRWLAKPLKQGRPIGVTNLKALINDIMLRRTKAMKYDGKPIIELPPITHSLEIIEFSENETLGYQQLENLSRSRISRFINDDTMGQNYCHILEMLCRLRQFCDHPELVPDDYLTQLEKDIVQFDVEHPNFKRLIGVLQEAEASGDSCAICITALSNGCITPCGHFFCKNCIEECLKIKKLCPMCRRDLKSKDLIWTPEEDLTSNSESLKLDLNSTPSSKINRLIHILRNTPKGVKTVIFSQWTEMLALVQNVLESEKITCGKYTGAMNRTQRDESLAYFQTQDGPEILLISLNKSIDRVHRFGQTKPVTVYRFVMRDSVEERVLEIQKEKDEMFKSVMGPLDKKSQAVRMKEIARLFGMHLDPLGTQELSLPH